MIELYDKIIEIIKDRILIDIKKSKFNEDNIITEINFVNNKKIKFILEKIYEDPNEYILSYIEKKIIYIYKFEKICDDYINCKFYINLINYCS